MCFWLPILLLYIILYVLTNCQFLDLIIISWSIHLQKCLSEDFITLGIPTTCIDDVIALGIYHPLPHSLHPLPHCISPHDRSCLLIKLQSLTAPDKGVFALPSKHIRDAKYNLLQFHHQVESSFDIFDSVLQQPPEVCQLRWSIWTWNWMTLMFQLLLLHLMLVITI